MNSSWLEELGEEDEGAEPAAVAMATIEKDKKPRTIEHRQIISPFHVRYTHTQYS